MRQVAWVLLGVVLVAASASADTHVTMAYHADGYYNYGAVAPPVDTHVEYWIGEKRLAMLTPRLRIIVDAGREKAWIVNLDDGAHVELPFDGAVSVDPEATVYFAQDRAGGKVEGLGERVVEGRRCQGYQVSFWVEEQDTRYEDRLESLWVTRDVPFDLELFERLDSITYAVYRDVTHWEAGFVASLTSIKGFPILSESRLFIKGVARAASRRLVAMEERSPPSDIYSVPRGSTRDPRLTLKYFNPFPYHGTGGILE